jgi:hypothetical protein
VLKLLDFDGQLTVFGGEDDEGSGNSEEEVFEEDENEVDDQEPRAAESPLATTGGEREETRYGYCMKKESRVRTLVLFRHD